MLYDVAIIGSGPAGLSAALTLKLRNKSIIWFGSNNFSRKISLAETIGNYPGVGLISGIELIDRFAKQAAELGLEITDKMVTTVSRSKKGYRLLAENDLYEARTILLATGVASSKGLPREEEMLGRGLSYCATCDGFFYKGKTIAVIVGSARFTHEVVYLADLAEKVYLYTRDPECKVDLPNVETLTVAPEDILGDMKVTGLRMKDGNELAVDGLFCLRDAISPSSLLHGINTEGPHIVSDKTMATNLPGCFAAGDCTGTPYQIAKAVGEGNIAALSIAEYLANIPLV